MHFKLEYTVREFNLQKEDVFQFDVQGIHPVHVELRAPSEEEQKIGHNSQHAFCTAQVEIEASPKNEKVFEKIENNSIIENEDEWRQKYKNQKDQEIVLPSINEFPNHFRSYLDLINDELSSACRLVVNAVRWRTNTLGPHNPISTRGLFWSRDKEFWHPAPSSLSLRLLIHSSGVYISEDAEADVKEIIISDTQEPVHHELFREAWEQRNGNARSSLITGLSALEVAIKTTISTLIPNTSWLVENIPSPPVSRLLIEYVPKLPAMNTVDGKVLPPPRSIMALIKKAVTIRNQITHIGGKPPDYETLDQILEAIQDTLWLLDYYSGHSWAYNHISESTKHEIKG
ncbi:hypothetical protein [Methylomonas rivi]|uniref:ApeA N-terminal domain-containing protein n=1 Tax=Methylomonas rivi TaxID=2952226 RepID=A0ABT1U2P7_9GAMM|nr:hypothetical protein [Methylomonas sp. WSC-6]MCQ8127386.1 hypothetical protein [Methylomonas sp. WSC-6]